MLGESAKTVRMTKLSSNMVITAVEDITGDLTVEACTVSAYGTIEQWATNPAEFPASIASIAAVSSSQVVTAVRNSAGDLQLDSWSVGASIWHQETAGAGAVSQLDITGWADSGHVATPVSNSGGKLEVIDWIVNPTTGAIVRQSSSTVVAASQVAASTIGTLVFTASLNASGKVAAGVWGYNGSQIGEGATAQDEAATLVSAAPLSTGPYTVTATCTKAGDLQLDVWNYFSIQ